MKKTLIVLTCALTIAGCDMPKDAKEARLRSAMMALPEGSKVVELIQSNDPRHGNWMIFELKGQCFLLNRWNRQAAMANIKC